MHFIQLQFTYIKILELIDLSSSKPLKTKIDTPIQPPTPKNVITELFGPSGVPNLIPITPIPIPTPGPVAVPYGISYFN